ncbi:HipA domain-containing protein [Zhihengliuella flava]|uniref:HipA-like C-terminal domain-containing protein n=1 Tax=Zhihengliuella flava TaxID=1285193 RepID=A0A931D852_9MICC|nr:HipA domain-containing protein [Zhihengliuella flava]MBG6083817.1 hypothetical protein [Zhihengliuella flava]
MTDGEVDASVTDASAWTVAWDESSGDSVKLWLDDGEGRHWLFKERRSNRSEDEAASEVAASRIARVLNVPAAMAMHGVRDGKRGALVRTLVDRNAGEELVEGQVLMGFFNERFDPYDKDSIGHSPHSLAQALKLVSAPGGFDGTAVEAFSLYLYFDALIGNTDRHSRNWALITSLHARARLAESFDHATSLGITTRDKARERVLDSHENLRAFVRKATARRFEGGKKVSLLDFADHFSAGWAPRVTGEWKGRLRAAGIDSLLDLVASSGLTGEGAKLAQGLLRENFRRCLDADAA